MILGLDVSHFQAPVNFAAVEAAGRDFVVLKATEGVGYTDPTFAASRKAAHAAGLIVGIYHFARDNTSVSEANYFAGAVGALQTGEFLVLDQEVAHAGGNVPWCTAWLAAVTAHYGINPLIYMNQGGATGVTSGDWTAVAKTYGLWLAKYDNAPATQGAVNYWGAPAMKQFYDKGVVPGVSGVCDVDSFFGTTAQLLAYGKNPPPTPGDTFMGLTFNSLAEFQQAVNRAVLCMTPSDRSGSWLWDKVATVADQTGQVHDKMLATTTAPATPAAGAIDLYGHLLNVEAMLAGLSTNPVTVDAAEVAAALAADTAAMDKLAAAIAAQIATRLGNG